MRPPWTLPPISMRSRVPFITCVRASRPTREKNAQDVIAKHRNGNPPLLHTLVAEAPPLFSEMLQRMMRVNPEERYADMAEVIQLLESFLGIAGEQGANSARNQHLIGLDAAYKTYYGNRLIQVRKGLAYAFLLFTLAALFWCVLNRSFETVGQVIGLVTLIPLGLFLLNGILTKSYLFRSVRNLFFGLGIKNGLLTLVGSLVFLSILYVVGWLETWCVYAVLSLGVAAVFEFGVLRPLRKARQAPLDQVRLVLRDLRMHGFSEEALHDFVYRACAGVNWEEFFEDLFGYEAMIQMRVKWQGSIPRRTFATWRDPIAAWLNQWEQSRASREKQQALTRAEVQRLKASGLSTREATQRARQEAAQFVQKCMQPVTATRKETAQETKQRIQEQLYIPDGQRTRSRNAFPLLGKVDTAFHWGGLLLAFLMILGAWDSLPFLPSLSSILPARLELALAGYHEWGAGGSIYAFVAGVILLIIGTSDATGAIVLCCLGSGLLVFGTALTRVAAQPQFTPGTAFALGVILVMLGLTLWALRKFTRDRPRFFHTSRAKKVIFTQRSFCLRPTSVRF